MPAYLIARIHVTDPKRYQDYAIAKHGGRYLVRGGPVTTLEGPDERDRVVVLEFPTMEHARTFWSSPEYEHARSVRAGAATGQFFLVDGYAG